MAYAKGDPVWKNKKQGVKEPGVWHLEGSKLYLAEINLKDPITGSRIRERKVSNRIDVLRKWRIGRKNAETSGELLKERSQKVINFNAFADEYYAAWKDTVKASTAKFEKNRIDGILKAYFGNKQIHAITRKDVETFLRKRRDGSINHIVAQGRRNKRKGGVSVASTNRELCRIKNMFKHAVNWGYLKDNPALGIAQVKEPLGQTDYLRADEVPAFLAAAEEKYRPIFVTAIYTGMRYGELMKLEWRDVNWDFNHLNVRAPKNDEDRYVPMRTEVSEALEAIAPEGKNSEDWKKKLMDCEELVFVNPATGKPFVDVRKAMRRALDKIEVVRHIRFHDLRHTTGSHLAMNGCTELEIAEILGHKDTTVTRRYTKLTRQHGHTVIGRLRFPKKKKDTPEKVSI